MKINLLYEDPHILVCEKPIGIDSQDNHGLLSSLPDELRYYLKKKDSPKSLPYLGIVHRLDRPVGGVMVYAKTKSAAANLSRQISLNQMQKHYFAVVFGLLEPSEQTLENFLLFDKKSNLSSVFEASTPGAKKAILHYRIKATIEWKEHILSLLDVTLMTGRHHQIRAQLSFAGYPIYGDLKYGGQRIAPYLDIGLFAYELSFLHPITGKKLLFHQTPTQGIFINFLDILKN